MNTVRLNITLPTAINDDMNRFASELHEKKSHIIASALEMYFDYLDLKIAEERLATDEETLSLEQVKKELGL